MKIGSIVAIVAFALVSLTWFFSPSLGERGREMTATAPAALERVPPVRLLVPSLGIDAPIEAVGLTGDGSMANPSGPRSVAWFDLGPVPGEAGSAVLAGHFGWKDNTRAVFDELSEIHIGEEIYVENGRGEITAFVVRAIEPYGGGDDALDVFISNDGKAHLNLVTCAGTWNKETKTYSGRVVVFTDEV